MSTVPLQPVTRRFRISLPTAAGEKAVVEIDDTDVADSISGFSLHAFAGQPAVLTLQSDAGGEIAGVAVVRAEQDAGGLVEFLHGIDPAELERVALAREDLDVEPGGLTGAMLRQLQEWAGGG